MASALKVFTASLTAWLVAAAFAVVAHAVHSLPGQLYYLSAHEAAVDYAVELVAGGALGFLVASLSAATAFFLPRRGQFLETLNVLFASLAIVGIALILTHEWLKSIGVAVRTLLALAAMVSAFLAAAFSLVRQWRRSSDLAVLGARLRFAGSAAAPLLVLAIVYAGASGVGVRTFDRLDERQASSNPGAADRPNIILVTFDALSPDDMSLYGYERETTPNIDALAKEGITFERFYSASNMTTPAIVTMLTGRSVAAHGTFSVHGRMAPELRNANLFQIFKRAGYTTGAIVTNFLAHPLRHGIDRDVDFLPPPPVDWHGPMKATNHIRGTELPLTVGYMTTRILESYGIHVLEEYDTHTEFPPEKAFALAEDFVRRAPGPYVLWVHILAPHEHYAPGADHMGHFLPGPEMRSRRAFKETGILPGWPFPADRQPEIDMARARYNEFIRHADAAFGDFLATLKSSGALEESVLVVSADHGESFTHGFWGHGGPAMWNSVVRIPLIVRLPGAPHGGQRITGVAGQVDLLPTLLDLAGLSPGPGDGRSMREMWESPADAQPRQRVSLWTDVPWHAPITSGKAALMQGDMKVIVDLATKDALLFDLKADPFELRDLSAEDPANLTLLRNALLGSIAADEDTRRSADARP